MNSALSELNAALRDREKQIIDEQKNLQTSNTIIEEAVSPLCSINL